MKIKAKGEERSSQKTGSEASEGYIRMPTHRTNVDMKSLMLRSMSRRQTQSIYSRPLKSKKPSEGFSTGSEKSFRIELFKR